MITEACTAPLSCAICLCAYNRPALLRELLASVARAHNAAQWPIFISLEPSPVQDEILAVVDAFRDTLHIHSRVNTQRLGVWRNPFACIEWALASGAVHILLLEDDLLIDPFALDWCTQVLPWMQDDANIMAANLLFTTCNSSAIFVCPDDKRQTYGHWVISTRNFSSLGLFFTRKQWQRHLAPAWFGKGVRGWDGLRTDGWDNAVLRHMVCAERLRVLQSLVPRVAHRGIWGEHVRPEFQDYSHALVQVDAQGQWPPVAPEQICGFALPRRAVAAGDADLAMFAHLHCQLWGMQRLMEALQWNWLGQQKRFKQTLSRHLPPAVIQRLKNIRAGWRKLYRG